MPKRQALRMSGALLVLCFLLISASQAMLASAAVGGCPVFPGDNIWNARIDSLPVDPNSDNYIQSIGAATSLHPDFGSGKYQGAPIGIPYTTVVGTQKFVTITFGAYKDESDPGPYPIPRNAPIEGGWWSNGDRHVLVVDKGNCHLYELYRAFPQRDGSWKADSGINMNLRSNALRPAGWTSADAAGLPIFAGLARYDEVASGTITHALRFTVNQTQRLYVWPARHYASSYTDPKLPPMGERFRLKASFDISKYPQPVKTILLALKMYGMFVADNGSSWYISGAPDNRWNNDMLVSAFRTVHGSDFEAVDESGLMIDPNSGQAKQPPRFNTPPWLSYPLP